MANEKRLIDAYSLAEQVWESKDKNPHRDIKIARNHSLEHEHFLKMICLAPTVDAVEVVHGRWTHDAVQTCGLFDDSLPVWVDVMQCSVCNEYIEGSHGTSYCPNCGAKMDGERKDNERKAD